MTNHVVAYSRENGGRVLLLFLLFFLAMYQFVTASFPAFAIICILPFFVLFGYLTFKYRMFAFWTLIIVNYFLQFKVIPLSIPMSLPNEMLQILLLSIAIIDARQTPHFERCANIMLLAVIIWCTYCTLEILNDPLTPKKTSLEVFYGEQFVYSYDGKNYNSDELPDSTRFWIDVSVGDWKYIHEVETGQI